MPIDSTIREMIKHRGHLTIDQVMNEVTSSNSASYYRRVASLGKDGDFITAPETSQLFGEVIGLWCIEQWHNLNCPPKINLIELGPGRGVLMRDLLKVAKLSPEFYKAIQITMVDINPHFIKAQKQNLEQFSLPVTWLEDANQMSSDFPSLIIANEFFDSLPVKQYVKEKELWQETTIISDPNDAKLKFSKIAISSDLQAQLLQDHKNAYDGAVLEESPVSIEIIKTITSRLLKNKGACLIIDYGYNLPPYERTRYQYMPTLQAIKNHQYQPILDSLGEADLSAHVDFYGLCKAATDYIAGDLKLEEQLAGNEQQQTKEEQKEKLKKQEDTQISADLLDKKSTAKASEFPLPAKTDALPLQISFTTQREFLLAYGITMRSQLLKKTQNHETQLLIERQLERLIGHSEMGNMFKVCALWHV